MAFTLIETMVAVILLALLVGAATLTFTGPIRRAQFSQSLEQLRYLDASTRDFARRSGRDATIVFDLADNTLGRRVGRSNGLVFRAQIPAPLHIDDVWTPAGRRDYGEVAIPVSPLGLSETYAVKLTGPDGLQQWILVAGFGGEIRTLNDDREIESILSSATPARGGRHAD